VLQQRWFDSAVLCQADSYAYPSCRLLKLLVWIGTNGIRVMPIQIILRQMILDKKTAA